VSGCIGTAVGFCEGKVDSVGVGIKVGVGVGVDGALEAVTASSSLMIMVWVLLQPLSSPSNVQ